MKKKKKTSIQVKTLLFLLGYNIIIITVLWISLISMFDIFYEKEQLSNLDEITNIIKNSSEYDLQNIAFQNDVCIAVRDESGIVEAYNMKMNGCIFTPNNMQVRSLMQEFINSDETNKSYKFVNEERKVSAVLNGVKTDDNYIFIYSNLQDISDFTVILKRELMYVFIASLIIAIITSIFLSNKITNPILKITKKAKKLGNSTTNINFEESGIKEIDELSDALKEAHTELSKTDELRRDLMANVSHDLKTPLTMIKAYAEMIRDISYKDKKKLDENVEIIVDETDRLTVLVNDILELSKMESSANTLNIEEFDLASEIRGIVKKYQIIKETEKYTINVDMPDKMLIKADKNKINQVIYNLVNNAINYTGDDKVVTIKVTKNKKDYLVEIIDTGKGIKESEIPYIWDKYYKKDKKHQRNVVSTGIGLSIVKEILELHKYEYGVKSKENKGSTFYFKIKM